MGESAWWITGRLKSRGERKKACPDAHRFFGRLPDVASDSVKFRPRLSQFSGLEESSGPLKAWAHAPRNKSLKILGARRHRICLVLRVYKLGLPPFLRWENFI